MLQQTAIFLTLCSLVLKGVVSAQQRPPPVPPPPFTTHSLTRCSAALRVSAFRFTPLARADARDGLCSLLLLLTTSAVSTVVLQLFLSTLLPFSFSWPAFLSGVLLSLSTLLLVPAIRLLGLSSLVLHQLTASVTSNLTAYGAGQWAVLGYDYDAGATMHVSDIALSTVIGSSAMVCMVVAISNRLWAEDAARTLGGKAVTERSRLAVDGRPLHATPRLTDAATRRRITSADCPPLTFETNSGPQSYAIDDDDCDALGDIVVEHHPPRVLSLQPDKRRPLLSSSSVRSSSLLPVDRAALMRWAQALTSVVRLQTPSVRLAVGCVCAIASAVLSSVHLLPIYATQRAGLLRLLPLTPYLSSIHIGLLSSSAVFVLLISLCRRSAPSARPSLVAPTVLCGVALSLSSYFLSSYMPSQAAASFSWYYYSLDSDVLAMAWYAVPMAVVTAAAWLVWKEQQLPTTTDGEKERPEADEVARMMEQEEEDEEERDAVHRDEEEGAGRNVDGERAVSWSNVSLWMLAMLLGTVAEGIAVIMWDEGY